MLTDLGDWKIHYKCIPVFSSDRLSVLMALVQKDKKIIRLEFKWVDARLVEVHKVRNHA